MIEQNQETKNVVIAIEAIKRIGIVKKESDICDQIGFNRANLSNIKMGRRNMPHKYINRFISDYHISRSFIYKKELPVFDPEGPFDKYNNLADPTNHDVNERLKRIERNQLKMIELLLKLSKK